jgi:dihydrofolate reductase
MLTHHARVPLELEGGIFYFVTDGIEAALEPTRAAADGKHVSLGGGADVATQYVAAGLLDEMVISIVPLILGGGARLLAGLGDARPTLEQLRVVEAPDVTHIRYAVTR